MKFCDECGSFMEKTSRGYACPRCGHVVRSNIVEVRTAEEPAEAVYVVDRSEADAIVVNQTCPECGHHEAYRFVSVTSGEHAGVKQDRTLEHYRCTGCGHTWVKR